MLAFARSCGKDGVSVGLLEVVRGESTARQYSKWIREVQSIRSALVGTEDGIRLVEKTISDFGADALIAVDESHLGWLSEHRQRLENRVSLLMPTAACLDDVASKIRQIEIANAAGFDVLPTTYISQVIDAGKISDDNFPVCLRPSNPATVSPSFKAKVFQRRADLEAFLSTIEEFRSPVIAQPFFSCPDLKVHGSRSEDGRILAMEPFFVERKFEGVTLTLKRGTFPPGVRKYCEEFAHLAGLTGGFHFDLLFFPERDQAYFLEVNARMGGITDKAMAFGYNQPRFILQAYGHSVSAEPTPATSLKRVVTKRAVLKHLIQAAAGRLTPLDYPAAGRIRHVALSLRDLLFARDSVFDRRDMVGTAWFNLQGLRGKSGPRNRSTQRSPDA